MYLYRRNLSKAIALLTILCAAACANAQEAKLSPEVEMFRPTPMPDRVVLTLTNTPATSQSVTWRTDTTVKNARATLAPADHGPALEGRVVVTAESTELATSHWPAKYHSVTFRDLTPNTLYAYRVGDGDNWSEWFHFRTAWDKPEPFSFVYFGDIQNGIRTMCSRVVRESAKSAPDARFFVFAGDLVDNGSDDCLWGEFFSTGGWLYGMTPVFPVPGNHEYYGTESDTGKKSVTRHWRAQFTLPQNGPEGLEEFAYYTDYQGVRIISLNSVEMTPEQAKWLDGVLSNNPNRWTVVVSHYPLFSLKAGRDMAELCAVWKPVIDKHRVDLVLTGHDHSYARSELVDATVYVTSVAGSKLHPVVKKPWMKRTAEDTQLFHVITVDQQKLVFQTRTATGSLYDGFELWKQPGELNRFVDKTPENVAERARARTEE